MNKSQRIWLDTFIFCRDNPGKIALIVTKEGNFEIKFNLHKDNSNYLSNMENGEWIKRIFLK